MKPWWPVVLSAESWGLGENFHSEYSNDFFTYENEICDPCWKCDSKISRKTINKQSSQRTRCDRNWAGNRMKTYTPPGIESYKSHWWNFPLGVGKETTKMTIGIDICRWNDNQHATRTSIEEARRPCNDILIVKRVRAPRYGNVKPQREEKGRPRRVNTTRDDFYKPNVMRLLNNQTLKTRIYEEIDKL